MLLGFIIIFIAKKEGTLLYVGKIFNVSVIYAMLTTSALLPFMGKIWNHYSSVSVLRSLLGYGFFLLMIPLILLSDEHNTFALLLSMLVFMISTLLMQYLQSLSVAKEMIILVSQMTANVIAIFLVLSKGWLITGYFLPHYLLLLLGSVIFPFTKKGESFGLSHLKEFLKNIVRYSVIISIAWPLTFYFLREYFLGRDPIIWDDIEFVLRICLSILGLNAAVILNYNWGIEAKTFGEVKKKSLQLLAFSMPIFIVGFFIAVSETSVVDSKSMLLLFLSYCLRILSLLPAYILMNRKNVKFIVFTELGSNLCLAICLMLGLNIGVVIFSISASLLLIVSLKCRKVL